MEICRGKNHLNASLDKIMKRNGEGVCLRLKDAAHRCGKKDDLLKVKPLDEDDVRVDSATVVSSEEGVDRMTSLQCTYQGCPFSIRDGYTEKERLGFRTLFPRGTLITFTFMGLQFEKLRNKDVPRFPVYVRIKSKF